MTAKKKAELITKVKVIYNPNAGKKRRLFAGKPVSLEEIKGLFEQYQIPADFVPTKGPGHATELAAAAKEEKYKAVIAAGGDGTVSEAASGLVNTEMPVGILPMGTFMNIARMLNIPQEMEKAVMLIKIGRTRKIDVGRVKSLTGDKPDKPVYFFENAGVGMEAELQEEFLALERGDKRQIGKILVTLMNFYLHPMEIAVDGKVKQIRASLVEISNGPRTGAALQIAPTAKLNDHRLTVSIFKLQEWRLLWFMWQMLRGKPARSRQIERLQGKVVKIREYSPRTVHADARIFGTTPAEFAVIPNALNVITGFNVPGEIPALEARTWLDY